MNTVEQWFTIMLIAHTQTHVILPFKQVGDRVNLEADVLGKYAARSVATVLDRVDALERQTKLTVQITGVVMGIAIIVWIVSHRR